MSKQNIIILIAVASIHVAILAFIVMPGRQEPEQKPLLVLQGFVLPPAQKSVAKKTAMAKPESMAIEKQQTVDDVTEETKILEHDLASVKPPRSDAAHLKNPLPRYPKLSRRLREQGVVILEVLILKDGTVDMVRIKKSSGYERLDEAALLAVKRWRYVPAKQDGKSVAFRYQQPVEFFLSRDRVL